MDDKVIVLVADRDDNKHGEISILDDMKKAERLVETLLEAGFEQERIRVFTGGEMNLKISHRPVVSLSEEGDGQLDQDVQGTRVTASDGAKDQEEATTEASGMRFSSLFRGG